MKGGKVSRIMKQDTIGPLNLHCETSSVCCTDRPPFLQQHIFSANFRPIGKIARFYLSVRFCLGVFQFSSWENRLALLSNWFAQCFASVWTRIRIILKGRQPQNSHKKRLTLREARCTAKLQNKNNEFICTPRHKTLIIIDFMKSQLNTVPSCKELFTMATVMTMASKHILSDSSMILDYVQWCETQI